MLLMFGNGNVVGLFYRDFSIAVQVTAGVGERTPEGACKVPAIGLVSGIGISNGDGSFIGPHGCGEPSRVAGVSVRAR